MWPSCSPPRRPPTRQPPHRHPHRGGRQQPRGLVAGAEQSGADEQRARGGCDGVELGDKESTIPPVLFQQVIHIKVEDNREVATMGHKHRADLDRRELIALAGLIRERLPRNYQGVPINVGSIGHLNPEEGTCPNKRCYWHHQKGGLGDFEALRQTVVELGLLPSEVAAVEHTHVALQICKALLALRPTRPASASASPAAPATQQQEEPQSAARVKQAANVPAV
ncbi:unnamed protein product [Vitrella brassicaformis CCMP3155]|uniref:Uncharacterized protein n=1 Tax=Vitrella brassicaformis (strain CCMP3155) TaxID=1169540 RepID=A0A0G4EIM5_VITBC|nr:unnamed protein product [Vitrella brassicaformis CCMP3155]|eukprot:CEL95742.1 unnamed protein product [Vitrella brassicaformis CCMP3155]